MDKENYGLQEIQKNYIHTNSCIGLCRRSWTIELIHCSGADATSSRNAPSAVGEESNHGGAKRISRGVAQRVGRFSQRLAPQSLEAPGISNGRSPTTQRLPHGLRPRLPSGAYSVKSSIETERRQLKAADVKSAAFCRYVRQALNHTEFRSRGLPQRTVMPAGLLMRGAKTGHARPRWLVILAVDLHNLAIGGDIDVVFLAFATDLHLVYDLAVFPINLRREQLALR